MVTAGMAEEMTGRSKGSQKRQMLVYLPGETVTAVKIAGVEDRSSVSSIVEEAVNAWLDKRKKNLDRKLKPRAPRRAVTE